MCELKVVLDQDDSFFIILLWGGVVWRRVHKQLFFKKLKSVSFARSLDEAKLFFVEIEEKVAKSFAVNSLSKRALLTSELVQKMQEKGISDETIVKTITFCKKIGALEDLQILENRIQKEIRRGHGLMYAKAKWQRAVLQEPVEWNSLEKRNLEKEAALQLIQKKGKKKDLFLFLLRRGFRSEIIKEVLNAELE